MVKAIKPTVVFKFSLLLIVATTGCARGQLWGMETELLAERLRNGNYELLQHLDFDELEVSHAKRLGDGALFYISEVYSVLDLPESRRRFLEASIRLEEDPWRREAAARLLAYYRGRGMYRRQGELSESLLDDYPEWDALKLYHLEALYEEERYQDFRDAVSQDLFGNPEPGMDFPNPRQDLLLWDGVSRHQLDDPTFVTPFLRLFREFRASSHHIRVYRYLEYRGLLESSFDPEQRFWLEYRMAAAVEDRLLMETLVSALDEEERLGFLGEATAVEDYLARSLSGGGDIQLLSKLLSEGLDAFSAAGRVQDLPVLRQGIIETADRLGDDRGAMEQFSLLIAETPLARRNSLLGSRIAGMTDRSPEDALKLLETYAGPEPDSWFLRRALEELITELLRREGWQELERLYAVARANQYDAVAARIAVILSRGPDGHSDTARRRLEAARAQTTDPYYQMMASLLLGNDGREELAPPPPAAGTDSKEVSRSPALAYVTGYLDYGLVEGAFEALGEHWDSIASEDAAMIARHLAREGRYYESMRIAERLRRDGASTAADAIQRLRYPRAFAPVLEGVSRDYGLPIWFWYALVREESYFSPAIESYAGAVGLAQLMPATAAEVAEWEGIQSPDLTNPETNLRLGASYLSRLFDRFDEPAYAIMAYNGGQGRMRRWLAESNQSSVLLFHEAIPVYETRHYLRKVALTAAGYALLYDDRSPRDTLGSLFPEVRATGRDS
ncbi:MAG: flagellar assembly lytic transglycosylase [Spirochaetaceae bacterium]